MLESMQSSVAIMTHDGMMVHAQCDNDEVITVAISERTAGLPKPGTPFGSEELCLTITHRPTGRRLGCPLPADSHALERAQKWRDQLLACQVDWTTVEHATTKLCESARFTIIDIFTQMQEYVESREGEI